MHLRDLVRVSALSSTFHSSSRLLTQSFRSPHGLTGSPDSPTKTPTTLAPSPDCFGTSGNWKSRTRSPLSVLKWYISASSPPLWTSTTDLTLAQLRRSSAVDRLFISIHLWNHDESCLLFFALNNTAVDSTPST